MLTKTLSLSDCKSIVTRMLDIANEPFKNDAWFQMLNAPSLAEIREELRCCDNLANLAVILEDAMMWVPKQPIDQDWWSDEMTDAYKQAEQLSEIL